MLLNSTKTYYPSLFQTNLDHTVLSTLLPKEVQAQCHLYLPNQNPSQNLTDKVEPQTIILQIIDEWVIQRSQDGTNVISGFKCDYEIQFQILRKMSQIPNRLGQADGIRFILNKQPEQRIDLCVLPANRENLEKFGRILSCKYIVQLGFHTSFKAIKKIGKGMTACVYNAISFATGKEVAIKSFKRSVYFAQDNGNGKISFCKQFKMLTQSNHRNICNFQGVYETENSTYVILELYPLSLYGYLQKFGFPNEVGAKALISHLLEGVAYLHDQGMMHRDLKLQNIMVKKSSGQVIPVIVDLGLAEYTNSTKYLYTRCGTPGYVAPEVLRIKSTDLNQTYTSSCDVFSLGVIYHILMFRKPIFEGKDVKQVIKKNCQCQITFEAETYKTLNAEARDFLQKILTKNPSQRLTAREALAHPYLSGINMKVYPEQLQTQNVFQTVSSIAE